MANRKLVLAALVAALSVPASAGVVVLGSSNARLCYEAADSPMLPQARALRHCDEALLRDHLSEYEIVATHVNRGILQLRRNLVELASGFRSRDRGRSGSARSLSQQGRGDDRRQDAASAVQLFTVAWSQNSRPAIAHYGRAVANEQLGDLSAAYRDFRRASEMAPNWREPRLELARFRVESD